MKLYKSVALLLVFAMVGYTMPAGIGSVSTVGSVELRGVRIQGDGTLFSGDRMNVGAGAYAKVALAAGPKIEVGAGSDVTVTREADNVQVTMASGNVAFKGDGKAPIQVRVGLYQLTVPGNASGNVAYVGTDVFGVRVLTGSVSVRNTQTKQSFTVAKGSERLISLTSGSVSQPLARLASAVPAAVPAMPQAQGTGLTKSGWIALLGTVGGAAAAIIVLASRNDDADGDAATRLAQVKAINNLNAVTATASTITSVSTTANTTATTTETAINASNLSAAQKSALLTQVSTVKSQANSAATKVSTINTKIAALLNTLSNQGSGPTSQQQTEFNALLLDLESARVDVNNAIATLNTLLSQAQGAGLTVTNPNLQNVNGPTLASASAPL